MKRREFLRTALAAGAGAAAGSPATPAKAPAVAREPVFDPTVMDGIPGAGPGSDFARKLLDVYMQNATELLAAIADPEAAANGQALVRAVHTLKSSSAAVGAMALSAMARQAEERMRAGEPAPADLHAGLAAEFARFRDAVGSRDGAASAGAA